MIHTFTALGCKIVVDVNSGAVHVLDDISYDILNAVDGPLEEEVPAAVLQLP